MQIYLKDKGDNKIISNKWKNGLPYVGNKRAKADAIISTLPSGNRLIDVFGGGGCISLHAISSDKYNSVIYNDKRKNIVELLKSLIQDKSHIDLMEYVSITREQFLDYRDNKPDSLERSLVLLCYSFGNNQKDYLFGENIEGNKLLLTNALFKGNTGTKYDNMYFNSKQMGTIQQKYKYYHKYYRDVLLNKPENLLEHLPRLKQLQQLGRLEQLERLQDINNTDSLIYSCKDYRDLNISQSDIVYCDPPYQGTGERYGGFDEEGFIHWYSYVCPAKNIFISEYQKLPNTTIISNLGSKHSFVSNANRKHELLLKVIN